MKKIMLLMFCLGMTSGSFAKADGPCGKKKYIDCKGVEGHKRDYFCSKKNPAEKKKVTKCKTAEAAKKQNKTTK
ncbi:MAG: hypothetical protein H6622_00160 [Halobacteriovoraceae bacterium]|nr:hypothetical protein [Halobacteriovoraceae bacterium]